MFADEGNDSLALARLYWAAGWCPVLLGPRSKRPVGAAWQTTRYTAEDLPRVFTSGANLGINLGEASNVAEVIAVG